MSLLPLNSTQFEDALEAATSAMTDLPVPISALWDASRCPAAHLPWLAWALSVDEWDPTWTEDTQRAVIASSVEVHRHKGTVWAMRRALGVAGLGDAEIHESWSGTQYDGTARYDGSRTYMRADHWAEYRVHLTRPVSLAQAARARAILEAEAPARCKLKILTFEAAAHLYNGAIRYDGTFNHGAA